MKLYVWYGEGVLTNYTSGMIVALGNDLQEALNAVEVAAYHAMQSFPTNKPKEIIDLGECPEVFPRAWVQWGGA